MTNRGRSHAQTGRVPEAPERKPMRAVARSMVVALAALVLLTVGGGFSTQVARAVEPTVSGSVSSSNGPVTDGLVYFYASCQDYADNHEAGWARITAGAYTLAVPVGTYHVWIDAFWDSGASQSWHNAKRSCAQSESVTVSGNSTANLVALPGSQVVPWVSSSNGGMDDLSVTLYATCDDYANGEDGFSGSTDQGNPAFLSAPDGTYRALITPDLYWPYTYKGGVRSWHNAKKSCAEADVVTVNGFTQLNLVAQTGSNVSGSISTSRGPVASGQVTFYESCRDLWRSPAGGGAITNGSYTGKVADGTYRVMIQPGYDSDAAESWNNAKASCEQADPVTVNGDTTINLTGRPGWYVTGSVTSSHGLVDSGNVYFYTTCEAWQNNNDFTAGSEFYADSDPYRVRVPAGTYRVYIDSWDNNVPDAWHNAKPSCEQADVVTIAGDTTQNLVASRQGEVTPTPTPPPPPSDTPVSPPASSPAPIETQTPQLAAQSISQPAPKVKRGKAVKLGKRTRQGAVLTWKSATKRVCKVSGYKLKALKKGTCKLRVSAPAGPGFASFNNTYSIKIA